MSGVLLSLKRYNGYKHCTLRIMVKIGIKNKIGGCGFPQKIEEIIDDCYNKNF